MNASSVTVELHSLANQYVFQVSADILNGEEWGGMIPPRGSAAPQRKHWGFRRDSSEIVDFRQKLAEIVQNTQIFDRSALILPQITCYF